MKYICCECGEEFRRNPSRMNNKKSNNVFCGLSCVGKYNCRHNFSMRGKRGKGKSLIGIIERRKRDEIPV